tara:strand:+ start:381 stop:614 length:234 start_codon:yes stop_codon:yes gene_type:complete
MDTIKAILLALKLVNAFIKFASDRQLLTAKGKADLADLLKAQADELSSAETIRARALADLDAHPERLRDDDGFKRRD